jgi:protein SCO1/2
VVVFGYHDCPNLCGVMQQVVATGLAKTGLDPQSYLAAFITIAPEETVADAAADRARLVAAAGAKAAAPWQFLGGAGVGRLADGFGIGATERARIRQFVHPVAAIVLTPDGRISRVLPGIGVTAGELRLALVEASAGRLGSVIEHVVLFCAGYDAAAGHYTGIVYAGLRIGTLAILALALGWLGYLRWRGRKWAA